MPKVGTTVSQGYLAHKKAPPSDPTVALCLGPYGGPRGGGGSRSCAHVSKVGTTTLCVRPFSFEWYLRLIDFVYHPTLGLRVIQKTKMSIGLKCSSTTILQGYLAHQKTLPPRTLQ